MTRPTAILFVLILLSVVSSHASEYLCRRISVDNGLSQSNVTAIVRDTRGFLWIGSKFGLNRYDFASVTNYYSDNSDPASITDNNVTALYVDSRDTLWVAGEKGVAYYCRHTDDFHRVDCDNARLNARSFYDEGDGMLIGGGGALYFFDYASQKATRLQTKGGSNNFYTAIHYWKPGYYVLTTRWDGLWLYNRANASISRLPDFPEMRIMASMVDKEGRLWVSVYDQGVICYGRDGTRKHIIDSGGDTVRDFAEKDGEIWMATDGGGIRIYNVERMCIEHAPDGVLDALGAVTRLFVDRHGDVYAGTVREGALSIRSVAIRTFQGGAIPELRLAAVSSIFLDKSGKRVWIGDDGHGVLVHSEGSSSFVPVAATSGTKVISIADFDSRSLIVSTFDAGLKRLDKSSMQELPVPQVLRDMYDRNKPKGISMHFVSLSNGSLAILTDHLSIFDPVRGTLNEPEKMVRGSIEPFHNSPGMLLYRGDSFIGEYDALTGTTRILHSQKDRIACAAFDDDHTIYLSTGTNVSAFDITDRTVKDVADITNGYISTLAVENGRLWIGTNNSLLMKDLATGSTVHFGRFDGVAANEYIPKATLVSDRYLYMGGVNGLVRIDRDDVGCYSASSDESVLSMTDLEIDGVSAFRNLVGDRVTVDHAHRNIRISIISDGCHAMQPPHYRFIVHGDDGEQYVETFSNVINIGSLKAGETYDISATAVSPDGTSGSPQHLLTMAVTAPWYDSHWIWIVAVLLSGTALFMAESHRRRIRRQHVDRQLEAVRRSSLEQEVAFLINTNYALRTPLTMIYAPIKMLIERIGKGEQVNIEQDLQNIYRNTKRMRDVIDMAMELHQVGTLPRETANVRRNMRKAIEDTLTMHADEIANKHIDIAVESSDSLPDIMLSAPDRIRVVLDILMHNAVRRSAEGAQLRISLQIADSQTMRISFADHGPALDEKAVESMFSFSNPVDGNSSAIVIGLAYARSIIDTMGGRIGADRNPDDADGITVWLELPVELAAEPVRKDRFTKTALQTPEQSAPLVHVDTSELTVVVVEEDNDLCMFVASQLAGHFKKVLHAFNGKDGLLLIRQNLPDIVVSSILLPFKSGIELCLDIKSNPDTRHIPVILLTTLKEGPQLENAYAAGADSYLSKPFDMNVLMMRMRNLLHSRDVMKQRYRPTAAVAEVPAPLSNADESLILKIDRLISGNIDNPDFNVDSIAQHLCMSRTLLYAKVKAITGTTIAAYINDFRLRKARSLLLDTSLSITEISERLGFSTQRYFSTFFKERTGMTPSAFRTDNKKDE